MEYEQESESPGDAADVESVFEEEAEPLSEHEADDYGSGAGDSDERTYPGPESPQHLGAPVSREFDGGGLFRSAGRRASAEPAFRIVHLSATPDGRVQARIRQELVAKVYRGPTALRWVKWDAMRMADDESVLILVRPTGSVAGVFLSGTGRKASPRIAVKARRMARELVPDVFGGSGPKHRTSRPKTTNGAARARRTSRASRR
jgi:hypothetical protein